MSLHELATLQIKRVCLNVVGRYLLDRLLLLWEELHLQLIDNRVGDFVLNRKDIGQIAIVTISPHVPAVFAIDQLACDAYARASLSNTSFQNKVDPETLCDFRHFHR